MARGRDGRNGTRRRGGFPQARACFPNARVVYARACLCVRVCVLVILRYGRQSRTHALECGIQNIYLRIVYVCTQRTRTWFASVMSCAHIWLSSDVLRPLYELHGMRCTARLLRCPPMHACGRLKQISHIFCCWWWCGAICAAVLAVRMWQRNRAAPKKPSNSFQ